jgi:hypothetical protein
MEDSVADWARMEAARRNTSVSRLVGEMLAEKMRRTDSYERAMHEALEVPQLRPIHRALPDRRRDVRPQPAARMSPVFVDTNVLLYTFDDAYPDKRDQARAWVSACWLQRRGRVHPGVE